MSNPTVSSPSTDEQNKLNTAPLSNAIQSVVTQTQQVEQQLKQNFVSNTNNEIEKTAGKIVSDIINKSTQTQQAANNLVEVIAKTASSKGFGAFAQTETWTAAKQLGDIMVCELIAKELEKNKLLHNGKISAETLINLYIGKTFGDQTFMGEVGDEIGKSLSKHIEYEYQNALNKANKTIDTTVDNVIQKINTPINQVVLESNKILNKITKFDINKSIEDAIRDSISIEGINKQLSKTWLGQALKPGLNALFNAGISKVLERMTDSGILERVGVLQGEIAKQQELVNKAQQLIFEHEKVIKTYIDEAKRQAEAIVTQYANQVISDIASKIGINLGGISGGLF